MSISIIKAAARFICDRVISVSGKIRKRKSSGDDGADEGSIKAAARFICNRLTSILKSRVKSDGDGGAEDGSSHVHPEDPFNLDAHSRGAEKLLVLTSRYPAA